MKTRRHVIAGAKECGPTLLLVWPLTAEQLVLPLSRDAWFLALATALLAAALFSVHRARTRRVLELERVRSRIAADLHDDLGASLARMSLLSEATRRTLLDEPERADQMLDEISTSSRELVTAVGDIAFSIDPARDRLDALVARIRRFAEELLTGGGIEWRLTVDGETRDVVLSSEQRRHVLAILKEGLHNAVRHARPRHVLLALALRDGVLDARLSDDGCGFQADVSRNGSAVDPGHGLRNMHDRAREIGARVSIVSRVGGGTRVSLRCPLDRTSAHSRWPSLEDATVRRLFRTSPRRRARPVPDGLPAYQQ